MPRPFNTQWDGWTPVERRHFLKQAGFSDAAADEICKARWDDLDDLGWEDGSIPLTEEIQIAADVARQVA